MALRIERQELDKRRERILSLAAERGGRDGVVFFDPRHVFYTTNFGFISTERPVALVLRAKGGAVLLVPSLEREHAEHMAYVDEVRPYFEYPGTRHPMEFLKEIVSGGSYATDSNGYGRRMGYVGPALSDLTGRDVATIADDLRRMMQIKSAAEVSLVRESSTWGHLAHSRLQRYSGPGAAEYEVAARASLEATLAMVDTLGRGYARDNPFPLDAHAGFRGQVGANSAIPHATTIHAIMRRGDTLVTGASGRVWGYGSELERTMFVGEPSAEQERYFDIMVLAQDAALAAIRPGAPVSDVDAAAQAVFREAGVADNVRHHTGHSLGMDIHESPFFDVGDPTVMQPGMVFSVEPGIYVAGLGGFRHSDTVVVTESGHERLTLYPRDLQSMVCG
jgi:Xaa-Pro dipeptidase